MEKMSLAEYFDAINDDNLYNKARAFLFTLPLSVEYSSTIESLKKELENSLFENEKQSISSHIDASYEYGNRIVEIGSNSSLRLEELSSKEIVTGFILKEVKTISKGFSANFEEELNKILLSQISKEEKAKETGNFLESLNNACLLIFDLKYVEVGLIILDTLYSLIDKTIEHLQRYGVYPLPRYDIDKIKEYLENPVDKLSRIPVSSRKSEDYYLVKANSENNLKTPIENNGNNQSYVDFRNDMVKLYNIEYKKSRIFDENSFKKLYSLLMDFNINPVPVAIEERLRLNYKVGGKGFVLGELLDRIFNSIYFEGNRAKFNLFVESCLIDSGGSEFTQKDIYSVRRRKD